MSDQLHWPDRVWIARPALAGARALLASPDERWLQKSQSAPLAEYQRVDRLFPIQQGPAIPW